MRANLVALAATLVFPLLASAGSTRKITLPSGLTHKPGWGNAIVKNLCDAKVGFMLDNHAEDQQPIEKSDSIIVPLYLKENNGGGSIKLYTDFNNSAWRSTEEQLSKPLTQLEFTPGDKETWYDGSNVNSDIGDGRNGNGEKFAGLPPFLEQGLKLESNGVTIPCKKNDCDYFYSKNHDDKATLNTPVGKDITLTLCSNGQGSSDESHEDSHTDSGGSSSSDQGGHSTPPSPSSTTLPKSTPSSTHSAQPTQHHDTPPEVEEKVKEPATTTTSNPAPQNNAEVVTKTETVEASVVTTHVVITATAPAQNEKRHEHIHQHVHNKINKRRHGA